MAFEIPDESLRERPRRLRANPALRRLVRETTLTRDDLVLPLFAVSGSGVRDEVTSMPGVYQESVDRVAESSASAQDLGVPAVILFGIPETKDAVGSSSWSDDGIVQRGNRSKENGLGSASRVIWERAYNKHAGTEL